MDFKLPDRGGRGPEHDIHRRPGSAPTGASASPMSRSIIHRADADLKHAWLARFQALPLSARRALRLALLDLRRDAQYRAEHQWRRHKGPMACYWRAVGVYAGHIARALR